MKPIIKVDLKTRLDNQKPFIIDVGCGRKKHPDSIGIDCCDIDGVDIVTDLEKGLSFLPDNCIDEIHCRSVLEHLENYEMLIREFTRILKPDGVAKIFVPHFSNPYFYSDYTHKRFFGLYTFSYFVDISNQTFSRKVPDHYSNIRISIGKQKLIFRSSISFCKPIKKLWSLIFNSCRPMQAFYEENLCYMIPCHGIEIEFSV